jgi:uncharacterized protein
MPHFAYAAALLALLCIALSLNVSRLRLQYRVSFGDGGHRDLLVASRAHGNALEQSLLFLALLAAAENWSNAPAALLQVLVGGFIAARVMHAAGLFGRHLRLRQIGHLASVALQLVLVSIIAVHAARGYAVLP